MRKRSLLIALMSASLLTLPSNSFAIQKGDVCKKAGVVKLASGATFTCVKKGKKLLWRERKAPETVAAPQVSPSPTIAENPFKNPFPDEFTRDDMVRSVITSFDSFVKANSSTKTYKLVVGPEYAVSLAEIRAFVDRSYSALPFPSEYQKTIVVITNNRDLAEREISSFGFDRSDSNKAAGSPCMNCAGEGWSVSDSGLGPVVPHEIFHVWQKSAYKRKGNNNPDPNNPLNPPVWFDEGSADLFGYLMYRERSRFYEGVGAYPPFRDFQPLKKYSTRDLDPGLPYLLGRVASEYIVASVGMERFLQIFFNVGEGLDFPRSFEKATGVTLDFFYEKFDKNIRKMF